MMKHHTPSLKHMAAKIRAKGQRKDTVLAHLNPHEAGLLEHLYGKDINPYTGLPQYGFFRKIEKAIRPVVKTVLPVAGSIIGGMIGGPAGAVAGGALGGGLSSKSHRLDHALGGAFVGLGHSVISPHVARMMSINPSSGLSKMLTMNGQTWGGQFPGVASAASGLLGGNAAAAGTGAAGATSTASGKGGIGGLLGSLGLGDILNIGLGATALIGGAK